MEKKMDRRIFLKASMAGGALVIAGDLLKGQGPLVYGEATAADGVFNAAMSGFMFLYAYGNAVAQEIGRERSAALMSKMFENMGAMRGKMIKGQAGGKQPDARAAWSPIKMLKDSIAQQYELVEESPEEVVARIGRCPIYEAARALGMDATTIEMGCRSGPAKLADTMLKQVNPNLSVVVRKFRSSRDDFCIEEIVLA